MTPNLVQRLRAAQLLAYTPKLSDERTIFAEAADQIAALEAVMALKRVERQRIIATATKELEIAYLKISDLLTAEADMRERAAAVCKIESFKRCPNCNTAANTIRALPLSTDAAPAQDTIVEGV